MPTRLVLPRLTAAGAVCPDANAARDLVNSYRARHGNVPALTWDGALATQAAAHAKQVTDNNCGSTPFAPGVGQNRFSYYGPRSLVESASCVQAINGWWVSGPRGPGTGLCCANPVDSSCLYLGLVPAPSNRAKPVGSRHMVCG